MVNEIKDKNKAGDKILKPTLLKFKANKTDKYKGIYKRVFKILNNGWYENAFESDESVIIDGYWNLYVEDDDYNPKDINWEDLEELNKIKGLEIISIRETR